MIKHWSITNFFRLFCLSLSEESLTGINAPILVILFKIIYSLLRALISILASSNDPRFVINCIIFGCIFQQ